MGTLRDGDPDPDLDAWGVGAVKTAREQLERWDRGLSIWTIEMGGLGPGYEQAIQVLAIEIVRDEIDNSLPVPGDHSNWGDRTAERIDRKLPDGSYAMGGFSGAQVGAAKQLAYGWLKDGPAAVLESVKDRSRHIQVSNFWPHVQKLNTFDVTVEARAGEPEVCPAKLLCCARCDDVPTLFIAYSVSGHMHLQCERCGETYCAAGKACR